MLLRSMSPEILAVDELGSAEEFEMVQEAVNLRRSFEAVFLLPMPAEKVSVRVEREKIPSPLDWRYAMGLQILVAEEEMAVAEESPISTQGTGVRTA